MKAQEPKHWPKRTFRTYITVTEADTEEETKILIDQKPVLIKEYTEKINQISSAKTSSPLIKNK
jgi:hypothetical protein